MSETSLTITKNVLRLTVAAVGPQGPAGSGGGGGGGSGDVTGPTSSVDNTIVRMDGTTGKVIQGSSVVVPDALSGTMGSAALQSASAFDASGAAASAQAAAQFYADSGDASTLSSANATSSAALAAHAGQTTSVHGLGTASQLNVAASGNAAPGEVVKGNDTRLSDSRTPTSHTHGWSDIVSGKPTTLSGYGIADGQPLDTTLTALAALDGTVGLLEVTALDTFTRRAIGVGASSSILTRGDGDTRYDLAGAAALVSTSLTTHAATTSGVHGITSFGATLTGAADAAAGRSALGLGTLATQNGTFSGTSSGTNTGDQTITLTGDVTGSGSSSFSATIANDAVTYAKMQNVSATDKLLGRSTAGAGDVEEIACTAFGRSLLDDAAASNARTTLGVTQACIRTAKASFGDGTNVPATLTVVYVQVPVSGTITKATIDSENTTSSATVDIWKDTDANYPPTVADSIVASAKPTLSSAKKSSDSTLTGWNKTVTAGDWLAFRLDTVSGATRVNVQLEITTNT